MQQTRYNIGRLKLNKALSSITCHPQANQIAQLKTLNQNKWATSCFLNKPFLGLTLKPTGAQEPQTLSHPLGYCKAVHVQMTHHATVSLRHEN